jgi:hypothetical protein
MFWNLNTHVHLLCNKYKSILDTSTMIPLVALTGCHLSGPTLEPRSVTVVLDELFGAPNVTSCFAFGQLSKEP